MDTAMEATHSSALEQNIDFTSKEICVIGPSDSSPTIGSEPRASVPIESDWDIFQHSPFGNVLNSLRSLSLSGES